MYFLYKGFKKKGIKWEDKKNTEYLMQILINTKKEMYTLVEKRRDKPLTKPYNLM